MGNTVTYEPVVNPLDSSITYNLKGDFDYFPYDKRLRKYNPDDEKYFTTQHQRDTETGFDYRGLVFSDVARFLSVDPLAVKYFSWSPYGYVLGNPVKYIDPDGRFVIDPNVTRKQKRTLKQGMF